MAFGNNKTRGRAFYCRAETERFMLCHCLGLSLQINLRRFIMRQMRSSLLQFTLVGLTFLPILEGTVCAQFFVPRDIGQKVNGFQDDFDGSVLNTNWLATGAATGIYEVTNGVLKVHSAFGDPNHLLYAAGNYDDTVQEVLARIRLTSFGQGDPARAGVGVAIDPASSQGINYHFRDYSGEGQSGRHTSFLDDFRAWGPGAGFVWETSIWYWVRLRQEPDAATLGGFNDAFAKVWRADGSIAEPDTWQTWDYTPARPTRTGLAGITAGSSGGLSEFEVDYILIKAAGLPQIIASPRAFPIYQSAPVITDQPQSQVADELSSASFSATAGGYPPPVFQWYRNGAPIPGATNPIYIIPSVALTDDQARFEIVAHNVVSNVACSATSKEAVLTVKPDISPPTLLSVMPLGLAQVQLTFSERLDSTSVSAPESFSISNTNGSLSVLGAALDSSQTNVALTVSLMTAGLSYMLTVKGVTDQAAAHNQIATNVTFTAVSYQTANVGGSMPPGAFAAVAGGYDLSAGGADIGGKADQFGFAYQSRSGDFDVQVRLDAIDAADLWSKAGLVARESLEPGSAFVGALATPGNVGAFFLTRPTTGAAANASASFSASCPRTWLRLQRTGNQFVGFVSSDGKAWLTMGSVTLSLPPTVHLGFALCSHAQGMPASVRLRDFTPGAGSIMRAVPSPRDPLGQCSRLTPVVISEIMYHPLPADGQDLEYLELYNAFGTPEDLSGYRLSGDIDYTFPPQTILEGGSYLVVARTPADVQNHYQLSRVLGPYTGALPKKGGTIRLRHRTGAVFLEINYGAKAPWPVAADGLGHSLVLARPSLGENDPQAWAASDEIGGSPGGGEGFGYELARGVVINEFLAHSQAPLLDYVELYNHSSDPADVSGCTLSDDPSTLADTPTASQFHIPPKTIIPPGGFVAFDESQLGFALKASGETIFLVNSNRTCVLDAVAYTDQADGISLGRYPDGAPDFYSLAQRTPGGATQGMRVHEIVISEIMYDPISGDSADQYVELYNQASAPVDIGGWQFTQGIHFEMPTPLVIPANGYLVVAKNATNLWAHYPGTLNATNTVGDFGGTLSRGGERLVLAAPEIVVSTNQQGGVVTNTLWVEVDEVTYGTGGRWDKWAAGGGSSLELIDPRSDHRRAPNWAASDETAKTPWTEVSYMGTLDNGDAAADELQVLLQGEGECLIDDVEVLNAAGVNQIANSTFETGATGWVAEGTEQQSGLESSGGYDGGQCYHVRASDRGDNQVNRVRTRLKSTLPAGSTATIRAKVRWLKGCPSILFRLRGKWLEAVGNMALPQHAGTPGAPNSRAVSNAPPAIFAVSHSPVVPAAGTAVLVTARVMDLEGVTAVKLYYRLDPSTTALVLPMTDDGTGGDAVAGDGIYSATIPGQASGTLVAFSVSATDGGSPPASAFFPADAPTRECLIRFGEPIMPGNIPVYRLWMTQATSNTWTSRAKLNNTPLDITFVLGDYRAVYNAQAMYAGSPYIAPGYSTPSSGRCGYSISFPPDDRFLGSVDLVLDWPGGHGNENTGIQEEMAYWVADQLNMPFSLRHFIRLVVNGVTDMQRGGVFEAINQPAGDYVRAWSPDDPNGDFYKIERGYEFSDSGGLVADPMPRLQNYTTTGGAKKTARYRWNWLKRAGSPVNDFTNIFNLVDAVNAAGPEPYTSGTEQLVDIEEWMRVFAFEHIVNNFDSWGHEIAKNMYAFKPQNGKWQIYPFDLDWLMLVSPLFSSRYANANGPLYIADDPTVVRMYNHPPFQRAYLRAVQDAVDGPLLGANCDPVMDAKYNWLVANGVTMCDGGSLVNPAALKKWFGDRRGILLSQLIQASASFVISASVDPLSRTNLATLTGTAPIAVKTIQVNGVPYEPVWTALTAFSFQVPLARLGTNVLEIQAYDWRAQAIAAGAATLTINYQGPVPSSSAAFNVRINEWMASNSKTLLDPATGHFDDWFELYNAGTEPANLAGCYLTGSLSNKTKFPIPAGYTVPAGGFLLVWADDATAANATNSQHLHVNFRLSAVGEAIGLFAPDGTPIDTVTFGAQAGDVSQGRTPDGGAQIMVLSSATPGGPNALFAPRFLNVSVAANGHASLTWTAQVGQTYQLQYQDDLWANAWLNTGPKITATTETVTVTDPLPGAPDRFYRLVQSP